MALQFSTSHILVESVRRIKPLFVEIQEPTRAKLASPRNSRSANLPPRDPNSHPGNHATPHVRATDSRPALPAIDRRTIARGPPRASSTWSFFPVPAIPESGGRTRQRVDPWDGRPGQPGGSRLVGFGGDKTGRSSDARGLRSVCRLAHGCPHDVHFIARGRPA